MAAAWLRRQGETSLWYGRFDDFRAQGPGRTLLGAYNNYRASKGRLPIKDVPGTWKMHYQREEWLERAQSWDDTERERLRTVQRGETDKLFNHIRAATRMAYAKIVKRMEQMEAGEVPAAAVVPQFIGLVRKLEELYERAPSTQVDVRMVSEEDRQAIRERILSQLAQEEGTADGADPATD